MDFKNLTTGRFDNLSTGNQEPVNQPLLPREPHTPPYQSTEVDIKRMEPQEVYLPHGKKHAEKFGIKLVLNIEQALKLRRDGLAVLTIREADIAARQGVPLNSDFLHKALKAIDGMFSEGIPGERDNAYVLRESYNRGINFKRQFYHKVSQERKDIADKALILIVNRLTDIKLPPWPEEVYNGFATELCKPEWMSWEQYREASKHCVIRDPEGEFNDTPNPA